jgi:hypothetical protein
MKKIFLLVAISSLFITQSCSAQDAKAKPSPAAKNTATIATGAVITIDYSQPAVKGRSIGKDLEPLPGKVWRTGANDATVFETSKDIMVEGKTLPAGKYGLFSILDNGEWTIIFNKTFKQWGAFQYKEADDFLRVKVKDQKTKDFSERMTFLMDKSGVITLIWGDHQMTFNVK